MHFIKWKKSVWEGNILYGSNQMKRQNCEDLKKENQWLTRRWWTGVAERIFRAVKIILTLLSQAPTSSSPAGVAWVSKRSWSLIQKQRKALSSKSREAQFSSRKQGPPERSWAGLLGCFIGFWSARWGWHAHKAMLLGCSWLQTAGPRAGSSTAHRWCLGWRFHPQRLCTQS